MHDVVDVTAQRAVAGTSRRVGDVQKKIAEREQPTCVRISLMVCTGRGPVVIDSWEDLRTLEG